VMSLRNRRQPRKMIRVFFVCFVYFVVKNCFPVLTLDLRFET